MPGLFKTLANNKSNPLPWRLFEVSDTVHWDVSEDVGASNRRRLCVVYSDSATSGFEIVHDQGSHTQCPRFHCMRTLLSLCGVRALCVLQVHGLVERILSMLGVPASDFGVRPGGDKLYLEGRCAEVYLKETGQAVGTFGTVHPEVLESFELEFPTSAVDR